MHHAQRLLLSGLLGSLAACSLAACGSDPVDLGHDDPHALGSALSDYAGTWQGYAEAKEFDDGTDRVKLQLAADGSGELLIGEADPLPPPDPAHGYPPGATDEKSARTPQGVASGFPYPIADARVEDNRIRIHSATGELYREWCDMMTPHLVVNATPAYYACMSFAGYGSDGQGNCTNPADETVIDCGLTRCLSVCECTESDCALAMYGETQDIEIDATLEGDGDSFVGTLVLSGERITVRLTRM